MILMLEAQLQADYKAAFKARNTPGKEILGLVRSAIQNKAIELQDSVDDATVLDIIQKEVKAIRETLGYLQQLGKGTSDEEAKLAILSAYLPAQLTQEEAKTAVVQIIAEQGIDNLQQER